MEELPRPVRCGGYTKRHIKYIRRGLNGDIDRERTNKFKRRRSVRHSHEVTADRSGDTDRVGTVHVAILVDRLLP